MPLPVNPPATPATLSQNARTVLEKRYLVKDKSGKPVETPASTVLCHKGINHIKSYVVARMRVIGANIAQSYQ